MILIVLNESKELSPRQLEDFDFSHSQRLVVCNLESLELRRIKRDVILVYKLHKSLIDISFDDYFEYANVDAGTRGNGLKLYAKHARTDVTLNFFANRVVNVWNALPENVVFSTHLGLFKKRLDENQQLLYKFLRGRAFRNH